MLNFAKLYKMNVCTYINAEFFHFVFSDGDENSDQRSVHLSVGSDISPSRKATVTDDDVIFFDKTPKSVIYSEYNANVAENIGKGETSRKFILSAIVCSLLLAIGLVVVLIVLVTPQLTKSGNNNNSVYNAPTMAPLMQITIPKTTNSYTYNSMHTSGTQIVDRRGQPVRLTGCNW